MYKHACIECILIPKILTHLKCYYYYNIVISCPTQELNGCIYKKQLEIPLMMGLWEPETCRVKKGNKEKEINTQNKQLHPLETLLQYVQKMHGMNNLKKKFSSILVNFHTGLC